MNPSSPDRCPHCGATLPVDAQFCVECGNRVAPAATGPTQKLREGEGNLRCPACGTLNPNHAQFCVMCGQSLPPPLRDVSPAPEPQPVVPTASARSAPPQTVAPSQLGPQRWVPSSAIFLIGLAVLAWTGWWWPGILVLIGIESLINTPNGSQGWAGVQGAIWLFGIALLAWTGWWWPGILILIGLSGLLGTVGRRSPR